MITANNFFTGIFQKASIVFIITLLISYTKQAGNDLTADDIKEIQKTWAIAAKDPAGSGGAILIAFFKKDKSYQQKFAAFKDVPIDKLPSNEKFKSHAKNVVNTFDKSIKLLGQKGATETLVKEWTALAKRHDARGITKDAFNALKGAIVEVLTVACKLNDKQKVSWTKLLDTVYGIIFKNLKH